MEPFSTGIFGYIQIIAVALLLYAIIFGLLKKVAFFDDTKVNSLIALLSVVIVSLSGLLTFVVTYAINWFAILLILLFMIILLLLFLGIKFDDITSMINPKAAAAVFGVLFLIILVQGFFALNNLFDQDSQQAGSYDVNTSANPGVGVEIDSKSFLDSIPQELLAAVIFLIVIGAFVIVLGRG